MKRRELLVVSTATAFAGCSSETGSDETTALGTNDTDTENESTGSGENDEKYTPNDETHSVERGETVKGFTDRGVSVRGVYLKGPTPGSLEWVSLTIENTRDEEIASIRVEVDFYDGEVRVDSGQETLRFLGSGENATVTIPVRTDHSGRISNAEVWTTVAVTSTPPLNDGAASVTDESFARDGERPTVSGRIENTTNGELAQVTVYVNFYDGDELIDWQRDGVRRLAPGSVERWVVHASERVDENRIDGYERRVTVQT